MRNERLYKFLAVIALVSVGIYLIACRPAWSPDSKKVAWIYQSEDKDDGGECAGLAIYDVTTGESKSIIHMREKDDSNAAIEERETFGIPREVFWLQNGFELVVISAVQVGERKTVVSKYNLNTGEREIIAQLDMKELVGVGYPLVNVLQKDRWLFIRNDKEDGFDYYRVDLKKRKVKTLGGDELSVFGKLRNICPFVSKSSKSEREDRLLFGGGKHVYFARENRKKNLLFGRYNRNFLFEGNAWFKVAKLEGEEIFPIFAVAEAGKRFAYLKKANGRVSVVVVNKRGKVQREIPLPPSMSAMSSENMAFCSYFSVWRGNCLWMIMPVDGDTEEDSFSAIVEIDVDRESFEFVRRFPASGESDSDEIQPVQLSLSPDNRYLAIPLVGEGENEGWFLGIMDLSTADREITIVNPPVE